MYHICAKFGSFIAKMDYFMGSCPLIRQTDGKLSVKSGDKAMKRVPMRRRHCSIKIVHKCD